MARIRTNAIYSMAYQIIRLAFPLITYPYVARVLGPDGIGIVSYTASIATMLASFALLGIPVFGTRAISRVRDDDETLKSVNSELTLIALFLSLFAAGLFLSLPHFGILRIPDRGVHLMFVALILFNAAKQDWYFQGLERFRYTTIRNLVVRIITASAIFLLVRSSEDVLAYAFLWVLGSVLGGVVNLFQVAKETGFTWRPVQAFRLLPAIGPSAAIVLVGSLYAGIDTLMLGNLVADNGASVGYYSLAGRLLRIIGTVLGAATAAVVPRLALYYSQGEHSKVIQLVSKNMEVSLFFALPASLGMVILAPTVVRIFGGEAFMPAISTLQIIAVQLPVLAVGAIVGSQVLYARDREKRLILSTGISLAIGIVLNFVLIPIATHVGAALATTVTRLIETLLQVALGWSVVRPAIRDKRVIRVLYAAGIWSAIVVPTGLFFNVNHSMVSMITFVVSTAVLYAIVSLIVSVPIVVSLKGWIFSRGKHDY